MIYVNNFQKFVIGYFYQLTESSRLAIIYMTFQIPQISFHDVFNLEVTTDFIT